MRNRLNPKNPRHFLILVAMLIVLGVCIELSAAYILDFVLNLMPGVREQYSQTIEPLLEDDYRIMLTVFLLAPIMEEVIFRLLILRLGKRYIRFWIINIIQGLLFGIYHGNPVQGVYAFLLGMLLGYVLEATDVIISSILVHMSINITGVMIQRVPLFAGGDSVAIPVIAALAFALGGIIVMGFTHPKGKEQIS